jgi:predicted RNA methylase
MKRKTLEHQLSTIKAFQQPKIKYEQYATPTHLAANVIHTAFSQGDVQGRRVVDLGAGCGMLAAGCVLAGAEHVYALEICVDAVEEMQANFSALDICYRTVAVAGCGLVGRHGTSASSSDGVDVEDDDYDDDGVDSDSDDDGVDSDSDNDGDSHATVVEGESHSEDSDLDTVDVDILVGDIFSGIEPDNFIEQSERNTIEQFGALSIDSQIEPRQVKLPFPLPVDTVVMNPPFGTKNNWGIDVRFLEFAFSLVHRKHGVVYSLHKSSTRHYLVRRVLSLGFQGQVLATLRYNIDASYGFHKKKSVDIEVDFIRFTRLLNKS